MSNCTKYPSLFQKIAQINLNVYLLIFSFFKNNIIILQFLEPEKAVLVSFELNDIQVQTSDHVKQSKMTRKNSLTECRLERRFKYGFGAPEADVSGAPN
ncbi:hypothetical protein BpHYR1_000540 [Brachionus plicatilis]|uniref:Uncharacterized protein n=1 Tax=Brachionus plicatilis TaxID=10195 RepID=A0A3M7PK89_BRAPC|nr:hypothetical protein BpHYR1_000540 [Brachionus plicatilis]